MKPAAATCSPESDDLATRLMAGDRGALARAITLIESTRPDHRAAAETLLARLLPATGKSIRIGISGPPGVGKSTFIERFGQYVIDQGHRIAVLAIDPSSRVSGGSILGDKTRMAELARSEAAFIRPSPAGGTLGGVARRTREALLACEAAGYDVTVVETVGVGQSETAVADKTDQFLLLLHPGGGDALQGIKRGIMELADLLVVNKADGDMAAAASRTAAEYKNALRLIRGAHAEWTPEVLQASGLTGKGIPETWAAIARYVSAVERAGTLAERRAGQARAWLWSELSESLVATLKAHPGVAARLPTVEAEVMAGKVTPTAAARGLLAAFLGDKPA